MPTPRNRKPVEIPSCPPVGGHVSVGVSRRDRMLRFAAGALTRVAATTGAHYDAGGTHRRLTTHHPGGKEAPNAGTSGGTHPPPSTFRGATARFVAFG